jgi:DNA-binding NtrC family response regulator
MGARDRRAPGTRVIEGGGAPALVAPRARLVVERGPDEGKEISLEGAAIVVGTDARCDLVLHDETVSKRHVELGFTPLGPLLRDLGSTNGTFVDGHRAVQIYLNRAARIEAGETRLRFSLLGGEVEIPLARATNFGALLGHSPVMRAAFAILERAARTDSTVLITGESGTGKELAARAVHEQSPRRDGPFVVFDCGAVTPTLLQSELFGHARGAFTGAATDRTGAFEAAQRGTLVLDEVGELPLELQPKLLRVLDQRTVQRLGETRARAVDVRFVACTNRNLAEEVSAGRFREDLFYRLSVISLRLPPLRERPEEVPRLVRYFMTRLAPGAAGEAPAELPPELEALLLRHDWPGNVRELRNVVERFLALPGVSPAALLAASASVQSAAAPAEALLLPYHEAKGLWVDRFEKVYLARLLEVHQGNVSAVSREAGISRQACYRLLEKHALRSDPE